MNLNPHPAQRITAMVAALLLSVLPVSAQDRPSPALDCAAGWIGFADDSVVSKLPIGAAARWHRSSRISIGPEVTFIVAESHTHQVVTGNLTFDPCAPAAHRLRARSKTASLFRQAGLAGCARDWWWPRLPRP